MSQRSHLSSALLGLIFAASVSLSTACTSEGDDDGFDNSYSNHIELTCNGNVIVDETFTSLAACESFRDANSFMCGSIELSVNC